MGIIDLAYRDCRSIAQSSLLKRAHTVEYSEYVGMASTWM
jgi:hypothetical protein